MSIGRLVDVTGTPKALIVDADGKIASEVAEGAASVMALVEHQGDLYR